METIQMLGSLGEFVGAIAVVATLIFLSVQVRYNASAMDETNRLERAAAIDRHNDSISRWRGRLMENEELARIWLIAMKDGELAEIEAFRLHNLWIDFVNTQRSNFARAKVVGDEGLARQAVLSVAAESYPSETLFERWKTSRPWNELVAADFVSSVDGQINAMKREGSPGRYRPHTL